MAYYPLGLRSVQRGDMSPYEAFGENYDSPWPIETSTRGSSVYRKKKKIFKINPAQTPLFRHLARHDSDLRTVHYLNNHILNEKRLFPFQN